MLTRLESFAKKGYLHPGTASFDHTQSQMELVQGKAALVTVGAWVANEMKDVTPNDFEWGFMPFPGADSHNQDLYVRIASSINGFIWKEKPELNKKWAKEFNLWLYNLDIQKKRAFAGGVPSRSDFSQKFHDLEGISPSVLEALQALERSDVKLVNTKARNPKMINRVKDNVAMSKVEKVMGDGYIKLITGREKALEVAKRINEQYMRALGK